MGQKIGISFTSPFLHWTIYKWELQQNYKGNLTALQSCIHFKANKIYFQGGRGQLAAYYTSFLIRRLNNFGEFY